MTQAERDRLVALKKAKKRLIGLRQFIQGPVTHNVHDFLLKKLGRSHVPAQPGVCGIEEEMIHFLVFNLGGSRHIISFYKQGTLGSQIYLAIADTPHGRMIPRKRTSQILSRQQRFEACIDANQFLNALRRKAREIRSKMDVADAGRQCAANGGDIPKAVETQR